jgi:hypothetical protein
MISKCGAARGAHIASNTSEQEEEKLDKVIQKLENMDEDDFEKLRAKRLEKMRRAHEQKIEWKFLGHGT